VVWAVEDEKLIEEAKKLYDIEIWKMPDILSAMAREVKTRAYRDDVLRTIQLISMGTETNKDEPAHKNSIPKSGSATSQQEYAVPILESLIEMNGSARAPAVLNRVYEKMKTKLKERDLQTLPQGVIRWKYQANWERTMLKGQGYLKKGLPRGIWEITDDGRKYYEKLKSAT